jgi:DNA invertase Pin-like site-specific DNA recombinase
MVVKTTNRSLKMIYGYTRVSTELQNTENQKHEIQTFAENNKITINKWVNEIISSRKSLKERRLGKLLKHLKNPDFSSYWYDNSNN